MLLINVLIQLFFFLYKKFTNAIAIQGSLALTNGILRAAPLQASIFIFRFQRQYEKIIFLLLIESLLVPLKKSI